MFKNIVVGVDDQGSWHDALALAKHLSAHDAQLTVAHVSVFGHDLRQHGGNTVELEAEERTRDAGLLEAARCEAGVTAQAREWRAASVGRGLHELVDLLDADLLVVGSSRRGLLGRALLQDDTAAALNGTSCAIAVAPAGYAEQKPTIKYIGVGYDGSPESEAAVALARQLAEEMKAELSGLQVVFHPAELFVDPESPKLQDIVDDAQARVAALHDVEPLAVYGHPADELASYSSSIDLLVIGSRGYGPIGRLVHGSTSHQLTRRARCPLLVLSRRAVRPNTSELNLQNGDHGTVATKST
jgi:nucleotide-binding universal stress UspA family protein